jgi:hypothetical protein
MKKIYESEIPKFEGFPEFIKWYCSGGAKYYLDHGIHSSIEIGSRSTETIVFSHGQYQVELYNINQTDDFYIDKHCHPEVRTFEWFFYPFNTHDGNNFDISNIEDIKKYITEPGITHGGSDSLLTKTKGYLIFVIQEWLTDRKGHISLLNYHGPAVSSIHEDLLRIKNKTALTNETVSNKTGSRIIINTEKNSYVK